MNDVLMILLRLAGGGLILLSILHQPIGKRLQWKEDAGRLTPLNATIFHVHAFFICLALVMMGLPCVLEPVVFLEPSRAALWGTWSLSVFWAVRLYCQWFVYRADFWRGKRLETGIHWLFTGIWLGLALLFGACGLVQAGWLGR